MQFAKKNDPCKQSKKFALIKAVVFVDERRLYFMCVIESEFFYYFILPLGPFDFLPFGFSKRLDLDFFTAFVVLEV